MKYSEMNEKQKKAFRNILNAANWIIGGYENSLMDYHEGDEDYEAAKAILADHEGLVKEIYDEAITTVYYEDGAYFGPGAAKYLKDIRFCGKDWLMERCEKRVKKMGY